MRALLSLDPGKMHDIDPSNACSLMAMWSTFSKCSETLEEGRRLENISWRVWSRESLCVTPIDNSPPPRASQLPSLSSSYSSSDSLPEMSTMAVKIRHRRSKSPLHEECATSLSKSRHLSPVTLERIVATIQEKTDPRCPLSPSLESSPPFAKPLSVEMETSSKSELEPERDGEVEVKDLRDSTDSCISNTTAATTSTQRQSEHRGSDTSVSSDGLIRSGSIVHGFSPVASSCRSRTISSSLKPNAPTKLIPQPKTALKSTAMFTLGGSSEDDESSFEQRVLSTKAPPQRSSLSQSLSRQNLSGKTQLQPKRTSFRDVVAQRRIQEDAENDEGAIESSDDEDTDDVGESAIDEDEEDADDWEDSNSDDGRPSQEPHHFRRVDSRPDLVSRRSMLTLALNKGQGGLGHAHSQPALYRSRQSTPPQGPSVANSPEDDDGMEMQTSNRPAIAVPPPRSSKTLAHSPRTTRIHMLSTELTESLRRNLLLERQEKSHTANAFLRRTRNAQSMANLTNAGRATGGPPPVLDPSKDENWTVDNTWEYHSKGW
ncbi:hypothetical protein H2200_008319 [Cladophialophora chaetospira]|uniref:Nitrogen regulatory protein areA GATA-like domain-containing protein n=1 Tax=Cladophialophora chaetospira TaxID=386627 RepID=A0AA38X5Q8_9EURO|nr:hypothetical protein H2200_008319 [Cladophialophora chaetospira]